MLWLELLGTQGLGNCTCGGEVAAKVNYELPRTIRQIQTSIPGLLIKDGRWFAEEYSRNILVWGRDLRCSEDWTRE
jgi:hypothetical protein